MRQMFCMKPKLFLSYYGISSVLLLLLLRIELVYLQQNGINIDISEHVTWLFPVINNVYVVIFSQQSWLELVYMEAGHMFIDVDQVCQIGNHLGVLKVFLHRYGGQIYSYVINVQYTSFFHNTTALFSQQSKCQNILGWIIY